MGIARLILIEDADGSGARFGVGVFIDMEDAGNNIAHGVPTLESEPAAAGSEAYITGAGVCVSDDIEHIGLNVVSVGAQVNHISRYNIEVNIYCRLEHFHNHIELLVGDGNVCSAILAGGVCGGIDFDFGVVCVSRAPIRRRYCCDILVGAEAQGLGNRDLAVDYQVVNQGLQSVAALDNLDGLGVGVARLILIEDGDGGGALYCRGVSLYQEFAGNHIAEGVSAGESEPAAVGSEAYLAGA